MAGYCYQTYVIDMNGGPPQLISKLTSAASFSPDQNSLIAT
jgi:hypothetical protein